jgi:hypothetical protein
MNASLVALEQKDVTKPEGKGYADENDINGCNGCRRGGNVHDGSVGLRKGGAGIAGGPC